MFLITIFRPASSVHLPPSPADTNYTHLAHTPTRGTTGAGFPPRDASDEPHHRSFTWQGHRWRDTRDSSPSASAASPCSACASARTVPRDPTATPCRRDRRGSARLPRRPSRADAVLHSRPVEERNRIHVPLRRSGNWQGEMFSLPIQWECTGPWDGGSLRMGGGWRRRSASGCRHCPCGRRSAGLATSATRPPRRGSSRRRRPPAPRPPLPARPRGVRTESRGAASEGLQ